MGRRKRILGLVILVICTAIVTFVVTNIMFFSTNNLTYTKYIKMQQVQNILEKYYITPLDNEKVLEGGVRGIVASLDDPYSRYMDKDEFKEMSEETSSSYAGIGVVVTVDSKDNLITVISPFEDSPGEKAGILPGDKIVKVDGQEVWGDTLNEAVKMLKGPPKTEVMVTIMRAGLLEPKEIKIIRDTITLITVKHKVIDDKIGYIRITRFSETTSEEFDTALDALYTENINGLIIDLRNNPGGLLDEVVEVADRLVPEGTVVYMEDREKNRKTLYSDAEEIEIPLAILVNEASASASEVLSGAVRDYEKGLLVGTKTYGKGVVQTVIPLGDGSAVSITTSKYYSPNGISIHGIGIEPDVFVELPKELKMSITQIKEEEDSQLQKAIEVVKK